MLQLLVAVGPETSRAAHWLLWLFLYFAHALTWTTAALLLATTLKMSAARSNALWRLACLGPLATTVVSATSPWGSRAQLSGLLPGLTQNAHELLGRAVATHEPMAAESALVQAPSWLAHDSVLASSLALLLLGSVAFGLLRFIASALVLLRMLHGRAAVCDARLLQRFERVRRRTQLRAVMLSESAWLAVPLVLGGREICIPQGKLVAFADEELEAIFAHELAHLERHDGFWFPLLGCIQALLWLQPLNRWAGKRQRESAELACDDRAVELTGEPLALARALVRTAELALPVRRTMLVPAMVAGSSQLERVTRLVCAQSSAAGAPQRGLFWPLFCMTALGLASLSLRVELVRARDAVMASRAASAAAPDAAAFQVTMDALAREERNLTAELARLHASSSTSAAPERLLELEQDLRHTRALQTWTQERFEASYLAYERERAARLFESRSSSP